MATCFWAENSGMIPFACKTELTAIILLGLDIGVRGGLHILIGYSNVIFKPGPFSFLNSLSDVISVKFFRV